MSITGRPEIEEHALYPVHEEDDVLQRPEHEKQVRHLRDVLEVRLPQYWVTGDVCMYWEERAFQRYVTPDVVVIEGEPHAHDVYLAWADGRALLAIEVGSRSTFKEDEGPKVERYLADLKVEEYLYFRPHRSPARRWLRLWRMEGDEVVEAAPAEGRVVSRALGLEFGVDASGFLRVYDAEGAPLLSAAEEHERAEAALAEAARERLRAAALELELERLRAELKGRDSSGGSQVS